MELTLKGISGREEWEKAGIALPGYDVEQVSEKAKREPGWVHFGIGNIFRIFIGGIADGLLEAGVLDRGITCVETFDYDVVDKIYQPYDNLGLSVILHGDGTREYKVLGSLAEAVKAQSSDPVQWERLNIGLLSSDDRLHIFHAECLQIICNLFTGTRSDLINHRPRESHHFFITYVVNKTVVCKSLFLPLSGHCKYRLPELCTVF